jgi:hypothetical protein
MNFWSCRENPKDSLYNLTLAWCFKISNRPLLYTKDPRKKSFPAIGSLGGLLLAGGEIGGRRPPDLAGGGGRGYYGPYYRVVGRRPDRQRPHRAFTAVRPCLSAVAVPAQRRLRPAAWWWCGWVGEEQRDYRRKRRGTTSAGWVRLVLLGGDMAERLRRRSRDMSRRWSVAADLAMHAWWPKRRGRGDRIP